MTDMPTMTASRSASTNDSHGNWKWIAVILTFVLVIAVGAISIESYYLYRAFHSDLGAPPALAPALPHPGAPSLQDPASTTEDDWAVPDPFATGHPWDQLNRLHQQMDQLFKDTLSEVPSDNAPFLAVAASPNLDVREEKDHYTVRADMPGADKATIKVMVEGRLLTISGERTAVNETKDNDKVVRSERSMAEFVRGIELPGPVKANAVSAKYDNGVLTLNLPKAEQAASGTQVPVH